MVDRVLKVMYKEVRNLHQAAYVLAAFTIGSQFLALIRDRLLAHEFGAGGELDLYYAAFRIPDLLYVLFASTLSVYVLIPFVAARVSGNDTSRARTLLGQIFSLFLVVYIVLAAVIAWFAPTIVAMFFPGFTESAHSTIVILMRILLLQPLFLGISSLLGVVTQLNHRFVLFAVSPLLYNLGIIFGLLVLYPYFGLPALVWGVVIGAFAHLAIQLPYFIGHELAPRFTMALNVRELREVLITSLPRALTLSLHQLALLGLVGMASAMTVGSVAVFQFAFNLQSVPLAIIGVSYSVAAFPFLSQLYSEKKYELFSSHIMTALRHIIFWSLPTIALFIVIRAQFVRVVLGTGAFDWDDTRLTAAALAVFSLSLVSQAVHLLLVRALYASGNTVVPFFTTLISSAAALLFATGFHYLFVNASDFREGLEIVMRLQGVVGTEILALPLGYAAALILESVVLVAWSGRALLLNRLAILTMVVRSGLAALAAGVAAYGVLNVIATGIETDTLLTVLFQGVVAGVIGLGAAFGTYYVLRSPELKEISAAIHRRIMRTRVAALQDEDKLSL